MAPDTPAPTDPTTDPARPATVTVPDRNPDVDEGGWVTARTGGGSFRTELRAGPGVLVLDEPASAGGGGEGPTPYDLLIGAMASCASMTLRMYAARKGWPLEAAIVRLRSVPPPAVHATDCVNCETQAVGVRWLQREIELVGPLTEEQRGRMLAIADRCPVKQTLERGIRIVQDHG